MRNLLLLISFTLVSFLAQAQEPLTLRKSPFDVVTMKYEDTYIKITYGRPHKNGRVIFGELVPYGKVWRTGANEATEITITKKVKIAGHDVPAGTYTLFTIPEKEQWTIILNKEVGQWGAYNYLEEKNLLTFKVDTEVSPIVFEPFTIEFVQYQNNVSLVMIWDQTKVSFPISFD